MKRQDDRCTAAYESKAFPYFTINVEWSHEEAISAQAERHALLHRMRFCLKYRGFLQLLNVTVDDLGGFHTSSQNAVDLLRLIVCEETGVQQVSWVKHETL